jgi:hypothetical protein
VVDQVDDNPPDLRQQENSPLLSNHTGTLEKVDTSYENWLASRRMALQIRLSHAVHILPPG